MGSSFIHLIRTDSNEFFLMGELFLWAQFYLNPLFFIFTYLYISVSSLLTT